MSRVPGTRQVHQRKEEAQRPLEAVFVPRCHLTKVITIRRALTVVGVAAIIVRRRPGHRLLVWAARLPPPLR